MISLFNHTLRFLALHIFYLVFILSFLLPAESLQAQWTQLGLDIDGIAEDDNSGRSVSISADGSTVAIAAPFNNGGGITRGQVRVYQFNGTNWIQKGNEINGEADFDGGGYFSVSLSADGSTLAIGVGSNEGGGTEKGHVRVYQFNSGTGMWEQKGSDIDGEANYDESGISVSISADGSTVAIGAIYNAGGGSSRGHVRVYQFNGTTWTQQGVDIDGVANDDQSGFSVSISADGSTVAIGAPNNEGGGTYRGHVRVYQFNGTNWTQQGADIDGEADNDFSGYSVSISADGSTVTIGAPFNDGNGSNSGHVRVYQFNGTTWTQQGVDIDGEADNDFSGYSVSISADGSTVAIGAFYNAGGGAYRGHVRVYQFNGTTWTQQGVDIDGEADNDLSGYSVTVSADGSTVAIGAINNAGGGSFRGHVRVYNYLSSAPEINLQGNIADIADGSTTPSLTNHTDFGLALVTGGTVTRTFTIQNSGSATLTIPLGGITITGTNAGDFTFNAGSLSLPAAIPASGSAAFTVTFEPSAVCMRTAAVSIANDDSDEHPYDFAIQGTGVAWTQHGLDIDGEANDDFSGYSVSISADGSTVAIGALYNAGGGITRGHVRVYQFNGTNWTQQGADIDGEANNDNSGISVSISADGSTVAIGAPYNAGGGSSRGHVRVYQFNGTTWTQQGVDIDGEADYDNSGWSVSISADGSTVAIGARSNAGNGSSSGHVRVYQFNGTTWTQQGLDIDGEAISDLSGYSVSISADGSTVAIGATLNDGNGPNSGHVRVYQFNGTTWTQQGADIDGEADNDFSGWSVSISADGSTVAIGARSNDGNGSNSGHVRVYQFNGTTWTQQGLDIDGEAISDQSGFSVSISADGFTVAIGARSNAGNGSGSGHVRVYGWNGTTWTQQGADIDGEAISDQSGNSISISADGSTVAIGAPFNDGNGSNSGHVRVYQSYCGGDPEINLQGNSIDIADEDTTPGTSDDTDFGNQSICGGTVVKTYTIQNIGTSNLTISAISISGSAAADFTVGVLTPASPIPASGSATFTVTFDPSATGIRSAIVNIDNDDSDEHPYNFSIQGTGIAPDAADNTTSNAAICEGTDKSLTGTPAGGSWSVMGLATGTITGSTYSTGDVATDEDVTIRYTIAANGSCPATFEDVTFTVNTTTVHNTTQNTFFCSLEDAVAAANPNDMLKAIGNQTINNFMLPAGLTFMVEPGTTVTMTGTTATNHGVVKNNGTIIVSGPSALQNNGTYKGNGTLSGMLNNNGSVSPGN
ncbi:MAG: choice-of-anchor D domain-containing protein [Saprospiraceae bacterium]|nr:choice-of-anchor D domain-containing protein [Saprospiraceae bacterium]